MSRADTRPPTISRTEGRTRRSTPARSQQRSDLADQVAGRRRDRQQDLSTSSSLDQRRDGAPGRRHADPVERAARLPRVVVDEANGSRPSAGWRRMSFRTMAPASPAPTIKTRSRSPKPRTRADAEPKSRLWKRTAPNPSESQDRARTTTTDSGSGWSRIPKQGRREQDEPARGHRARTSRRASWTLAYRHICP